jgi:hypothetical protein
VNVLLAELLRCTAQCVASQLVGYNCMLPSAAQLVVCSTRANCISSSEPQQLTVTVAGFEVLLQVGSAVFCPGLSQPTLATFVSGPRRVPSARQRMAMVLLSPAGMAPREQLNTRGLFSLKAQAARGESGSGRSRA